MRLSCGDICFIDNNQNTRDGNAHRYFVLGEYVEQDGVFGFILATSQIQSKEKYAKDKNIELLDGYAYVDSSEYSYPGNKTGCNLTTRTLFNANDVRPYLGKLVITKCKPVSPTVKERILEACRKSPVIAEYTLEQYGIVEESESESK